MDRRERGLGKEMDRGARSIQRRRGRSLEKECAAQFSAKARWRKTGKLTPRLPPGTAVADLTESYVSLPTGPAPSDYNSQKSRPTAHSMRGSRGSFLIRQSAHAQACEPTGPLGTTVPGVLGSRERMKFRKTESHWI
ncbi:uncharacterized protein LOC143663210 [Tamandua tetradactyla]|uniref:uncharacterized protein LOC143663210 n=1 Tax=Tamandua tetradactyla TaxID=48850 RepID=UPI004053B104